MAAVSTPALDSNFAAREFQLKSVDGGHYGLSDFAGCSAVLVMFICNHCPYVKSIIKRLVADVETLVRCHNVGAVAIMPNDTDSYPEDSYDNMVSFAREHSFPFQYLIDIDQSVARSYGAVCTPDFFCFGKDMKLRYRGRFDDPNKAEGPCDDSELFRAVKLISETGDTPERQIPSIGCSIKWRTSGTEF